MGNAKKQAQGLFLREGTAEHMEYRKNQMQQHPEYKKRLDQRVQDLKQRLQKHK